MPSKRRESPYRTIVEEFRDRIADGELRPGDRVPSIRDIANRWGVAIATATKVTATLREEGLVETKVGAGTRVSPRARRGPRAPQRTARRTNPPNRGPSRTLLLRTAIDIADAEGLDAVSMRRLATQLGVGPMSLYRHLSNKDELLIQIADTAFAELDLPEPDPDAWRANLELVARQQWQLCRQHLWLPRIVSFTRPPLAPNMMACTEWTLRALDGLDLPMTTKFHEALTLHALVVNIGMSMAEEIEAEQNTGVTLERWTEARAAHTNELLNSGKFPLLAAIPREAASDLNGLFEYGLARHLDGFAALVAGQSPTARGRS
jgi:DNA-binding transcriptional regulator YhcF (GntR family)